MQSSFARTLLSARRRGKDNDKVNAPIDISHVRLQTKRLLLRPWTQDDLDDLFAYAQVDGVGQMAGWLPHRSKEESQVILNHFMQDKKTFAIVLGTKVIGSVGIEAYDEKIHPELDRLQGREIGYVLSKDYWGQGLMPEAVKAVIAYLFSEVGLDFLLVGHFAWNRQSARVIEKCGFSYLGTTPYTTAYGTKETSMNYILYNPSFVR